MGTQEWKKTRFASAEEIAACARIRDALCPGDRVVHYENWELAAVRRLVSVAFSEQHSPEGVRTMERQQAVLLMEGRAGLLLLRDWRCVLRVRTDAAPEEEPF